MDLHNIGEFHCDVCFELFGENWKCPKILVCGHSFCHTCLENLLVQSPSCPNCKQAILYSNVDSIPVNYIVKSIVSRLNVTAQVSNNERNSLLNIDLSKELKEESVNTFTLKKESSSKELPYEGYCGDHNVYNRFRCMDCKCWICGDCVALNHKPCRTLLVTEALNEMKKETSGEVKVEIEAQKSQNKCLEIYLNDLEGKRSSLKKEIKKLQLDLRCKIKILKSFGKTIDNLHLQKSDRKKHCEKLKRLETSVKEATNDDQLMKAKNKLNEFLSQAQKLVEELSITRLTHCQLTLKIVRDWCKEGSVYASRYIGGVDQYGQVVVKGDRVWVHSFKPQRPQRKNVVISFRDLLITFNGSFDLPRRGFIQVDEGTSRLGDVVIATDALTPRAMNFLLLCSGIKGKSYEGVRFLYYGSCMETQYFSGGTVVKGIKDGGVYEAPRKKGFVLGYPVKATEYLPGFTILMIDYPPGNYFTKFGFVEEGLDMFDIIHKTKFNGLYIKDCGLVL